MKIIASLVFTLLAASNGSALRCAKYHFEQDAQGNPVIFIDEPNHSNNNRINIFDHIDHFGFIATKRDCFINHDRVNRPNHSNNYRINIFDHIDHFGFVATKR
ncbi:hypothetical protein PHMEG_00013067 [Phytophthora megakarya]|uniref:Uncharacterized protein n=1 Tax=Phytophthora megakarya TaxID=4795 RepID=A0A225W781_9STRA|nr:hypothetical protein PHMEG_00013067 [Phytophthora megakarya]